MSHHTALADLKQVKDLLHHRGPLHNAFGRLGPRCSAAESPPIECNQYQVFSSAGTNIPVYRDESQAQTLRHVIVQAHYVTHTSQPEKYKNRKSTWTA
jgi:hypothetical protein